MEGDPLRTKEHETKEREQRNPGPTVWVGSLADYNAGRLYGAWLLAAQEPAELREEIGQLMRTAPTPGAEEWAIFDADGFHGLDIGEWEDLSWLTTIAKG